MSVGSIEKLRHGGKVVGFRQRDTIHEMFDGGATRKRRLEILARKLALFVIGEFGTCPTEAECDAILKLNEAIGLVDKAGKLIS